MLKEIMKALGVSLTLIIGVCMFVFGLLMLNFMMISIGFVLTIVCGFIVMMAFDDYTDDCDRMELEAD